MSIVIITGSNGLVGSEAVNFFSKKGFKVLGIDNNLRKFFFGNEGSTSWLKKKLSSDIFSKAVDFCRITKNNTSNLYHHIGIYAFTRDALVRYVKLKRSRLELERKLEQLRALENNISIYVGYVETSPLSVDTKEDLIEVKKVMETNGK